VRNWVRALAALAGMVMAALAAGAAEDVANPPTGPAAQFVAFDSSSTMTLDHSPWTSLLQRSVLLVGRSKERLSTKRPKHYVESHIAYGNPEPSRFEGNRVYLHLYDDKIKTFLAAYQAGLQNVSEQISPSRLSRDEQLAYWLNLYNVTVLRGVAALYPVSRLKDFRLGEGEDGNFWAKKQLTVEGVRLSLDDIESILIENWRDPLVLYGLWQGAIGGPSLPNQAFTAKNVWPLLRASAEEFVNSNRAFRVSNSAADVSLFYQWAAAAFPDDSALLAHLRSLAHPPFDGGLGGATEVKYRLFDWNIADMLGGRLHAGRTNSYAAFIGSTTPEFADAMKDAEGRQGIPPQMRELMKGVSQYNILPAQIPTVTMVECPPGNPCGPEKP
jgi:Protein of unknown function, DUF547